VDVEVEIVALVTSPGHSYWFHSKDPADGVGPYPTLTHDAVELVAGQGIVGDRFYGKAGKLGAAVSFLAAEVVDEVAAELGLERNALDPVLMRRNVVVRGVDLNALRRERFTLRQGDDVLEFAAGGETAPCAWMDRALAPGARDLLRGRGGLKATPVTSGTLATGPAVLGTTAPMSAERAGHRVQRGHRPSFAGPASPAPRTRPGPR
jgi:MOSC domain-containing protein YiiM